MGFDQVIVRRPASHDDVWGNAGFVFAHTFEDSFALLRRGGAVWVGGVAKDDDGVEVGGGVVVVVGMVEVVDDDDGGVDVEAARIAMKRTSLEKLHGNRGSRGEVFRRRLVG